MRGTGGGGDNVSQLGRRITDRLHQLEQEEALLEATRHELEEHQERKKQLDALYATARHRALTEQQKDNDQELEYWQDRQARDKLLQAKIELDEKIAAKETSNRSALEQWQDLLETRMAPQYTRRSIFLQSLQAEIDAIESQANRRSAKLQRLKDQRQKMKEQQATMSKEADDARAETSNLEGQRTQENQQVQEYVSKVREMAQKVRMQTIATRRRRRRF